MKLKNSILIISLILVGCGGGGSSSSQIISQPQEEKPPTPVQPPEVPKEEEKPSKPVQPPEVPKEEEKPSKPVKPPEVPKEEEKPSIPVKPVPCNKTLNLSNLTDGGMKIMHSMDECGQFFPIPSGLLPSKLGNNITIEDLEKNNLNQRDKIRIDTPYFVNDHVVHPIILDFQDKYVEKNKYWLGITPYHNTQDAYENPTVYESNNLKSFKLIARFKQPFSDVPKKINIDDKAYNSDINFGYDPFKGEVIMMWRTVNSLHGNKSNRLFDLRYVTSKDGVKWSEENILFSNHYKDPILSPSILYNTENNLWYLYYVGYRKNKTTIAYRTASNLGGMWSDAHFIDSPKNVEPWHLEARFVGKQTVLLINDNFLSRNLYFALSQDGENFKVSDKPLLIGKCLAPYKASFSPVYNENGSISFNVYWTSSAYKDNGSQIWQLFYDNIVVK
ncbi:hypothetical protein BJD20_10685 [Acinetobacter proteolyticus]|uniref:hypothetical protein n=1 Tax=Acinetobacter proteolyticus TaxID=1776741 RepID=UPI0008632B4A|nr:hypothetical protein [Acinetobacter proteolyticus]OEY92001.1 hypothetical protein BJD20_10685 [Acinetobacter proteolyticus]QHH93483.1 hypothetical protein FPL18_06370 [Acinetobacter gyllenbergii]